MWTREEEASVAAGQPGQDLVMTGYMALAGSAVMADWDRNMLLQRLPEELLQELKDQEKNLADSYGLLTENYLQEVGASAWYPVSVGGVFDALWRIADRWGTGFTVQMKQLPVRQETIEVCELEEKNPYYLWSRYCLLIAAEHGDRVCQVLRERGIPAAVIGVLTDKKDKVLLHDSTVSCLNRPREDELDLFLKEHGVPMCYGGQEE